MARLPRLVIAGHPHLILQRGHFGQQVFVDDEDRRNYLTALRELSAAQGVAVHAYVLLDDHVHVLATPETGQALSRLMQGLGRRYGAAFNRRHGRSGTLWQGRFRTALVDAGRYLIPAMLFIEQHPVRAGRAAEPADYPWSSARHHLGIAHEAWISDASPYWRLGNTPFERESAYALLLSERLAAPEVERLAEVGRKGWALGSAAFMAELAQTSGRPLAPRARGRPRKLAA